MVRPSLVPSALSRPRQYPLRGNGLIEIPDEMREVCAVFSTGRFVVRSGRQFDPEFLRLQQEIAEAFALEPVVEQATPQQISDLYLASEPAGGEPEEQESHKRYAARLLKDAAAMRASDVKVIRRSRQTDVRIAVAGREIDYGAAITVGDGRSIIAYLFDARDEGSGHTTKQQHAFQSFSITPGHSIPLPDRIQKIRGQKGFHEGASGIQEHMVLRIVYDDNDDVETLDDLGFDPLVLADLGNARAGMKGAVIVGGETGDGKSTSILRCVEALYDEEDGQLSVVHDRGSGRDPDSQERRHPDPHPVGRLPGRARGQLPGGTQAFRADQPPCRGRLRGSRCGGCPPDDPVHRNRPPGLDHHPHRFGQFDPVPDDRHGRCSRRNWRNRNRSPC